MNNVSKSLLAIILTYLLNSNSYAFGTVSYQVESPVPEECSVENLNVRFMITPDGSVINLKLIKPSDSKLLNEIAIDRVSETQFVPYDIKEFDGKMLTEERGVAFVVNFDKHPHCEKKHNKIKNYHSLRSFGRAKSARPF